MKQGARGFLDWVVDAGTLIAAGDSQRGLSSTNLVHLRDAPLAIARGYEARAGTIARQPLCFAPSIYDQ